MAVTAKRPSQARPRSPAKPRSPGRPRRPAKPLDPRDALLAAATQLFAARGFTGVSVRDIAAAAKVNHGLVHRHFGSKEALLRAVMQRQADQLAAAAGESIALGDPNQTLTARLFAATQARAAYWRILARWLLDGRDPRELQLDFPTLRRLIDNRASQRQESREAAAVDIVTLVAAAMGFLIFEPFLRAASDLDRQSAEKLRQAFVQRLAEMADR